MWDHFDQRRPPPTLIEFLTRHLQRIAELVQHSPYAIEPARTSLLQASGETRYHACHVRRSIRGGANQLLHPAGDEDIEQLVEYHELSETGVWITEWDGFDVQVKELALPNKPNSNINIGRALVYRCIQNDRKSQTSLRTLSMV